MARAARVLATAALFVVALLVGVVLHSATRAARRLALGEANRALAGAFRGRVEIEAVRRWGLGSVAGVTVVVRDPAGRIVAVARDVRARVEIVPLVASLIGRGPLDLVVDGARARSVEVTLVRGPDGRPTIVYAFEPAHPAAAGASTSRGLRLEVRSARVAHAYAHGQLGSMEDVDAVVNDLVASFTHDAASTAAEATLGFDVRGVAPQRVTGTLSAAGHLAGGAHRRARASVDARYGDVPVALRASLHGDDVDASADARPGRGHLTVHATATLGDRPTARAAVTATGVDPSVLAPQAPAGSLTLRAQMEASEGPGGAIAGRLTVHGDPGRLASTELPAFDANARFTRERTEGSLRIDEPGAPADVRFDAGYPAGNRTIDFDVRTQARDLARVGLLRATHLRGAARLHARGRVDVARSSVDARFDARFDGASMGSSSVEQATAEGRVQGPLRGPELQVSVRADGVNAVGRRVGLVTIDAHGVAPELTVVAAIEGNGAPEVRARGAVAWGKGVTVRDAAVEATRDGADVVARVARVHIEGGAVAFTGLVVSGAGRPLRAQGSVSPRRFALELAAPGVDLTTVGALLGKPALRGHASAQVSLRASRQGATGKAQASLECTGLGGVRRTKADLDMQFEGRRVDGRADVDLEDDRASVRLDRVMLDGPPGDPSAWERATGAADVEAAVDLSTLRRMLPAGALPFESMGGRLSARAHVARARPRGVPDVTIDLSTRGLALVGEPVGAKKPSYVETPERATAPKLPWQTRDADVRLSAKVDGAAGALSVDGSVVDRTGTVLSLSASTHAPLAELWKRPSERARLLERVPVQLHVEVPTRELSALPPVLRPAAVRGRLGATLDVGGDALEPRAHLQAHALGVASMQSSSALPFDGTFDATYDGRAAILRAIVRRPEGVVLDLRADVDAAVAEMLSRPESGLRWDAGATIALHGFPLQGIPQIATRGVGGRASGVVTIEGLHRDARLGADLRIDDPRLGVVCFRDGSVQIDADGRRIAASARFDRPGSFAMATIETASAWGAALTPSVDTSRPIDAALRASDFRAAALMPFVEGVFNQLDGRIDADARIHVDPEFKSGTVDGDVRLSKGIVEIPALGEELHDVSARLSVRPWGTLRLDDVKASGPTGHLSASAIALLDGLVLRRATADVEVPRDQRMPLTVEGVSLGEASGRVHAEATMSPDQSQLDVVVNVPELHVNLPQTSSASVQSLDPAPHVLIGMYENDGRFVVLPMHPPERPRSPGSLRLHVVVHLGDDVRLRRDSSLDVLLAGSPVVDVTDTTRVSGTIHVSRGTVQAFGKRFTIEPSSTVSFTGDTSNPQLVVTAMYDAPDQTHIYAEVLGPLKKLSVKLRSEPQRSQDEILGLLLFGSEQGLAGTPPPDQQPDPTQRAAGLASGLVTEGINKALSGITSIEIATRVDTTQAANPRPEVEVRLSNDVLANVTVNTGMPAPGEPPDRTLLTVDWRFRPRWSLEATVGDEGSTFLDLLWRHRY